MGKNVDFDQMASSKASWFRSTVFSKKDKLGFSRTKVKHPCDSKIPVLKVLDFLLLSYYNKAIDIINFIKLFSKFYHRYSELIGKYNVGQKRILEPVFYGDFVCKFKTIVGKPTFWPIHEKVFSA